MARAIVTFARSWPALAITRSLGKQGIEVFCGDEAPLAACFFSKYCTGSFRYRSVEKDPEGFLSDLLRTVKELKPRRGEPYVLFPVHKETFLIAQHRGAFEDLIHLALPDYEKIHQAHDKGRLAELALQLGIRTPRTYQFRSVEELYCSLAELSFPVFVKLRESASGVGVKKCRSPEELIATFRRFVDGYRLSPQVYPLVQEFVPGDDFCVTALFNRGSFVAGMTYRNVRSFPPGTGAGALRETAQLPEAEEASRKLLEHLCWHGIAELDWRVDPQSTSYLIEVNPRFFGGLHQAIAANVDYPYLLFRIATGAPLGPRPPVDYEARTETPVVGLLATLEEIAHDERLLARLRRVGEEAKALGRSRLQEISFRPLLDAVKEAFNPRDVRDYFRGMFEKHAGAVNDVLQSDDPRPIVGLLFPVALMLKHRRLSLALLTGERDTAREAQRRRFRDLLRRPRWRVVLLTALLVALSTLLRAAPLTRNNLGLLAALPLRLSEALFGSLDTLRTDTFWGALRYTACHGLHLLLWYLFAALLLRQKPQRIKDSEKGTEKT